MKITKIIMLMFGILFVLSLGLVFAHEHDFDETKQIIDSGIGCDKLTDEQLESIGDYYMEQMHPGEAHEMMDQMMGGEGSESLRQVHINMAKRLYCNENVGGMMGGGMMGMMMGNNTTGSGMMGMMPMMMDMMGGNMMGQQTPQTNMMGTNMMSGSFGGSSWWLWSVVGMLFWIALLVALILLIIWLYKKVAGQATNGGSALEILKKRFAKGKITKKEFETMKKEVK